MDVCHGVTSALVHVIVYTKVGMFNILLGGHFE